MAAKPLTRSYIRNMFSLFEQPQTDKFFTNVRDDATWEVTGQSFLSGNWTSTAAYRAATFEVLGGLVRAPGTRLKVVEGERGIVLGENRRVTVELYSFDTFTNSGVPYNQFYAWHIKFDNDGLIAGVKVYLDTLTIETVLGAERELQEGNGASRMTL
ncbi:MAG: hypothetical protein Q9178_002327 [Gyalolechia marmorata]